MTQFIEWSVIIFSSLIIYARGQIPVSVTFEGRKSGNTVIFNCSFGLVPQATSIQFLVNSIPSTNIRLYQGKCYLTHTGGPCNANQCQCSHDGKRYYWTYDEPEDKFTATCKAKINRYCTAGVSIQFTEFDLTPHVNKVTFCSYTNDAMHKVKGKTSTILSSIVVLIIIMIG
ncbi:uncharacterized protein LOC143078454 [Mytilus galloprovincialis]|uniref:uncharacterized protein LOC143078454 n=1 Tax=Mytilus galloprovincialis TaxID=29158 RepID=UPI003F7C1AF2